MAARIGLNETPPFLPAASEVVALLHGAGLLAAVFLLADFPVAAGALAADFAAAGFTAGVFAAADLVARVGDLGLVLM